MMVSTYMCPGECPSTFAWMTLSNFMEAIFLSSSCLFSSWTRVASLPGVGHLKTRWKPLYNKRKTFFRVSSFLPFPLSLAVDGFSYLWDFSASPAPLPLPLVFLPCLFEDSFLNSIKDLVTVIVVTVIAEARSYTPCLLAQSWPIRITIEETKESTLLPMLGISKWSSWNSLMYSRIWPSLCWRHCSSALASFLASSR